MLGAAVKSSLCGDFTWIWGSSITGVHNLQDLTPDDLRWSWCNNNRNKVHNKWNVLELSWNHPLPHPWSVEKLSSTKPIPGAKTVGDCCSRAFLFWCPDPGFVWLPSVRTAPGPYWPSFHPNQTFAYFSHLKSYDWQDTCLTGEERFCACLSQTENRMNI